MTVDCWDRLNLGEGIATTLTPTNHWPNRREDGDDIVLRQRPRQRHLSRRPTELLGGRA